MQNGIMQTDGNEPPNEELRRQDGGHRAAPKLMETVRHKMRLLHLAKRTEEAYVGWIVDFLKYSKGDHGQWLHPNELTAGDIESYLTHLAVERCVASSTQNQAFSAILFLYRRVLKRDDMKLDAIRAKPSQRLPLVLTPGEVRRILEKIPEGPVSLMAGIMYGAGLRVMEACRLRVKDIDFDRKPA
jgi:site-specific recombinase XerD